MGPPTATITLEGLLPYEPPEPLTGTGAQQLAQLRAQVVSFLAEAREGSAYSERDAWIACLESQLQQCDEQLASIRAACRGRVPVDTPDGLRGVKPSAFPGAYCAACGAARVGGKCGECETGSSDACPMCGVPCGGPPCGGRQ